MTINSRKNRDPTGAAAPPASAHPRAPEPSLTGTASAGSAASGEWDHSTHREFFEYYARESASAETLHRFQSIRDRVVRVLGPGRSASVLDVADVGCGGGTQCQLWAQSGHRVHGVDVNAPLIELARQRAAEASLAIRFEVGSATALPWASLSMDVCLVPELLEHVADWERCLDEFTRVLRPGGVLFLSTTNKLCPIQQEFELPLYSWYPAPLKRHFEHLAVTTRPELAGHAKYPAVNWFSYYGLRDELARRGLSSLDRFDLVNERAKGRAAKLVIRAIRAFAPVRFLGHVLTPFTVVVAIKS